MRKGRPDEHLFVLSSGNPRIQHRVENLPQVRQANRVPCAPDDPGIQLYNSRHSFASKLFVRGVDLKHYSRAAGTCKFGY